MAHRYELTGINPVDPIDLYIYTDDDNLINWLEQPQYRSADAIIKSLALGWNEYIPQDDEGSPLPKNIDQFRAYVETVVGTQTYMVRKIW